MKSLVDTRGAAIVCLFAVVLVLLAAMPGAFAGEPDPNRYIVSFSDTARGKAALRGAGAEVLLDLPARGLAAVHIPAGALNGLRNHPGIEYIEKDVLRYPMAQTTPWGIPAVQADQVSDAQAGSRTICIIDSGYAMGHPDLPGGTNVTGENAGALTDSCYHGSHVAGTIAALTNNAGVVGVLPSGNINLHIVKVFDGANCAWSYSSNLIAALDECIMPPVGANVVSMSLGGSFKSRSEDRAFSDAYNAGVLSIAAAGNDGNTRKSYPASYNSVISVAAIDSAKNVADFSQRNDQVELAAPGVAVRSTVGVGAGLEESLTVDGATYEAAALDGSASANSAESGVLVDCGLGTSPCSGANGNICLIQRGDITFAEKAENCLAGGGDAAVIYNNGGGLYSGTLGESPPAIHTVAVSTATGEYLLNNKLGTQASVIVDTGDYAFYDGTSMATPHVSGVAALVWSHDTSCTNAEIRDVLAATSEDLGPAGRDTAFGYGLVKAFNAYDAITDPDSDLLCGSGGGGGGGGGEDPPPQQCDLLPKGAECTDGAQCCSGNCKGKSGAKTCK